MRFLYKDFEKYQYKCLSLYVFKKRLANNYKKVPLNVIDQSDRE